MQNQTQNSNAAVSETKYQTKKGDAAATLRSCQV